MADTAWVWGPHNGSGLGEPNTAENFLWLKTEFTVVPEPATVIIWSLLGAGSWLGIWVVRKRRGGSSVGRQPWTNENRAAIHEIIARGTTRY